MDKQQKEEILKEFDSINQYFIESQELRIFGLNKIKRVTGDRPFETEKVYTELAKEFMEKLKRNFNNVNKS